MALILHIDTNTEICSVALSKDGLMLAEQEVQEGFVHASRITLLIQDCFAATEFEVQQLEAVALSKGPGSYTGLRVGAATAKGICYALGIPLIAVSSLQALALAATADRPGGAIYCPMIDARRMEVYLALYDSQNEELLGPTAMIINENSFEEHLVEGKTMVFCGNGAEKCKAMITSKHGYFSSILSAARHLIPLATAQFIRRDFVDLAYFAPLYLKPPNITKAKKIL